MIFNYKYSGSSSVQSTSKSTDMSFAPDTLREPTFFRGTLHKNLPFREAISALHHVVVSDLRFKPKDREEYKAWAAEQEQIYLEQMMVEAGAAEVKAKTLRLELNDLNKQASDLSLIHI